MSTPYAVVYAFAPAGGSAVATFRKWSSNSVFVSPIELPGHGGRLRETPLRTLDDCVDHAVTAITESKPTDPESSVFLLGHSFGALVAGATLCRLAGSGMDVSGLVVSGKNGPGHPSSEVLLHRLPDRQLTSNLASLGGIPPSIADDPDIMAHFLPTLRADLRITETARGWAGDRTTTPVTVVAGIDDPLVSREGVEDWQSITERPIDIRFVEGDHFSYLQDGTLQEVLTDAVSVSLAHAVPVDAIRRG